LPILHVPRFYYESDGKEDGSQNSMDEKAGKVKVIPVLSYE
jgi:hypothetical protein